MKNVIIVLGLLLCSASVFAQSQEDYLKTVDFINKAFNEKQASLIYEKFNTNLKSKIQKRKGYRCSVPKSKAIMKY